MLFKHIPVGIAERTLSFNQDVKALTFQYPFQHEFMLNWFHSKEPLILNMVLETGIGAGKLDTNDLKNLVVFSPSKSEQTKIASFLSSADQRINMLTQKKEKLEQYKKGIMQQIFSQQLRFKDENGKDYPEWEEKRLGDVGKTISGLTYNPNDIVENGTLVLRSSNIKNRELNFTDNVFVDVSKFNPVKESDILICVRNGSRNLIGKNALIKKEHENFAFGAFMSIYRSKHNKFIFQFLDTDSYYMINSCSSFFLLVRKIEGQRIARVIEC